MKLEIYQINDDRDINRVCFLRYEHLDKIQHSDKVNSSLYDKVYEGNLNDCKTLEDVYMKFNANIPYNYKGRSLSVSDVVYKQDDKDSEGKFYYVNSFGFKEIEFDKSQTEISKDLFVDDKKVDVEKLRQEYPAGTMIKLIYMAGEETMHSGLIGEVQSIDDIGQIHINWENGSTIALNSKYDAFERATPYGKISVLLVEPNEHPKMIEIVNNLKSFQNQVDGSIECLNLDKDVVMVCDEEGKLKGKPFNRAIYQNGDKSKLVDIIQGSFFICYSPIESDEFQSLPKNLADKYTEQFYKPQKVSLSLDGKYEIKDIDKPNKPKYYTR